jgi:NAD(P)-dependent dehydrogenase (short-subunit alcohol dehydrogenase family)
MNKNPVTYGPQTTTDELLEGKDLSGRRVLVTGASAGLGAETARALAAHGASVVMTARDAAKGERAANAVRAAAAPNATVELRELDLASLASVRACADKLLAEEKPFDVVIANAGVMACPQGTTADGLETQFGTNHLGHFVLVNRLVPLLVAGAPSRIVMLSSLAHRLGDVDLDDPGFERTPYDAWVAYGRSKTANALFAVALDRRLRERGVRACAVHPGGIQTELSRHLTPETMQALMQRRTFTGPMKFKSVPAGAATSVWAATVAVADEIGGRYLEDCGVAERSEDTDGSRGVLPHAIDPDRADALWARSEELVGERFPLD